MKYIQRITTTHNVMSGVTFDMNHESTRVDGDKLYLKIKECNIPLTKGSQILFTKNVHYNNDNSSETISQVFEVQNIENDVIEINNPSVTNLWCDNIEEYSMFDVDMDYNTIKRFNYLPTDYTTDYHYCILTFTNKHYLNEYENRFRLQITKPSKWRKTKYFKTYEELITNTGVTETFYSIKQVYDIEENGQVKVSESNSIIKGPFTIEEYQNANKVNWDKEAIVKEDGIEVKKPIYVQIEQDYDGKKVIIWHQWVNGELVNINTDQKIIKYWVQPDDGTEGYFFPRTKEYSLTEETIQSLTKDVDAGKIDTHFYKHYGRIIDDKKLQVILDTETYINWIVGLQQCKFSILYNIDNETYDDRIFFKENGNKVKLSNGVVATTQSDFLNYRISLEENVAINLHQEENLTNSYIDNIIDSLVPPIIDYEKNIVKPYIQRNNGFGPSKRFFEPANRIIFNLHFRDRLDEQEEITETWSTDDSKYWNEWNDKNFNINKSDLLWYLGFDWEDVYYQKLKLQKSFLRLSFYDSKNPYEQNLLFYSTVFVDTGELFGKYNKLKTMAIDGELSDEYDSESDIMDVDIEGVPRLSSQFIVTDKFNSDKSSEGFYLYLFASTLPKNLPKTIYMKVEFNHAKYGKTIPFLYFTDAYNNPIEGKDDVKEGYMTKDEKGGNIIDMQSYFNDVYIELEVKYDNESKSYIYYLPYDNDNMECRDIIFNLFEPRING